MSKAKYRIALVLIFIFYIGILTSEYRYSANSLIGTNDFLFSTLSSTSHPVEDINVASPSIGGTTAHKTGIENAFSASINRHIICPQKGDTFIEGKGGHAVLEKIKMGLLGRSQKSLQKADMEGNIPRVLCLVYTVRTPKNYLNAKAISDTWAKKCDKYIAASNINDPSTGEIDLKHNGPESYSNMWQKVQSIWKYAYENYLDEYDFFYIAGDDTYLVIENLKAYLISDEVVRLQNGYQDSIYKWYNKRNLTPATHHLKPRPLILAQPMMDYGYAVPLGGSGYVLNKAALKFFGEHGLNHHATLKNLYRNDDISYLHNVTDSREDIIIGQFFTDRGIYVSNTYDVSNGGRRFAGSAQNSFDWNGLDPSMPKYLESMFGIKLLKGIDSVSDQQISFHMKDDLKTLKKLNLTVADLIYRYDAFLYDRCFE